MDFAGIKPSKKTGVYLYIIENVPDHSCFFTDCLPRRSTKKVKTMDNSVADAHRQ
ncbi:hypothetical protein M2101_001824 [Parabacteroides sp. PM5-20]|nr:hypothetical protein [Parabacteroides sp. PM5-20]